MSLNQPINPSANTKHNGYKALFVSLLSVCLVAFIYIGSSSDQVARTTPFYTSLANVLFMIVSVFCLFTAMVTTSSDSDKSRILDNGFMVTTLSMVLIGLEIISNQIPVAEHTYFWMTVIVSAFIQLNLAEFIFRIANISGYIPRAAGILNLCLVLAGAFFIMDDLGMSRSEEILLKQGVLHHFLFANNLLLIVAFTYVDPSIRMSPKALWQSLKFRLLFSSQRTSEKHTFYAIIGFSLILCLTAVAVLFSMFNSSELNTGPALYMPILAWNLSIIPIFFYNLKSLKIEHQRQHENNSLAALVSSQARRFMSRYNKGDRFWSTTVGLRTANFMIDHDPQDSVRKLLPSYMVRIRQNQIQKIVHEVLAKKLIDKRVVSNQLYGTIDPEFSVRPCIDVILMFTTVYLDAIPIVESRLKNLAKLLPILDDDLAKNIDEDKVERSFSRIQWFFHVDFDWFDQHMTTTFDRTSYEVNIDNLRLRDRQKIISILEKNNLMGNFIGIGERARERIVLEAPYLANIIEAWPLNLIEHNDDKVDGVIFLIRFEQLIPRMQKYFNLEMIREAIKFHEPTEEARKIINIAELEISGCNDLKSIKKSINFLKNYPWKGFREKDLALQALIRVFDKSKSLKLGPKERSTLKEMFVETVNGIGYPSQEIHLGHMEKMKIRRSDYLVKVIQNHHDSRFIEGWLLLATTSPKVYGEKEILQLLAAINKFCKTSKQTKNSVLNAKIPEAFFNLSQEISVNHIELISDTCNQIAKLLIRSEADPEVFCFFIDGKVFLEGNLKCDISLTRNTTIALQSLFSSMTNRTGSNPSVLHSLGLRWKILENQASRNHPNAS